MFNEVILFQAPGSYIVFVASLEIFVPEETINFCCKKLKEMIDDQEVHQVSQIKAELQMLM